MFVIQDCVNCGNYARATIITVERLLAYIIFTRIRFTLPYANNSTGAPNE